MFVGAPERVHVSLELVSGGGERRKLRLEEGDLGGEVGCGAVGLLDTEFGFLLLALCHLLCVHRRVF